MEELSELSTGCNIYHEDQPNFSFLAKIGNNDGCSKIHKGSTVSPFFLRTELKKN